MKQVSILCGLLLLNGHPLHLGSGPQVCAHILYQILWHPEEHRVNLHGFLQCKGACKSGRLSG